ncbi:MAG: rod shape-determining protein MreC, partial [Actinomycetota bacterium]|nr:rod shape-determining protein MreC [Actinomycetota bacterium]
EASPVAGVRARVGEFFGPVQEGIGQVVRPISGLGGKLSALGSGGDRIEELERANEELRRDLATSGVDKGRLAEVDRLLGLAGRGQYRILPARVVAYGPAQGFAWTVTIDAGANDGLTPNLTVLNGQGLVGRVKTLSPSTATVVLVTDPTVKVGVRLENMTQGFSQGAGFDAIVVDLLNPAAVVANGDRLVTFGSREGAPFVPGVPFGEVVEVQGVTSSLAKRVKVRPFADFAALDLVGVVVELPRRDPRNSVLPPKPATPSPATPALPVLPPPLIGAPPSSLGIPTPTGTTSGKPRTGTTKPPSSRPAPSKPATPQPTATTPPTPRPSNPRPTTSPVPAPSPTS